MYKRKYCTSWGIESVFYNNYAMLCLVTQLCLTLCDPMDYSPPCSSVHGILQARTPERIAILFSKGSSWPRDQTRMSWVSCIAGRFCTGYGWFMLMHGRNHHNIVIILQLKKKKKKDSVLPMQGVHGQSLVGELGSHVPLAAWSGQKKKRKILRWSVCLGLSSRP